MLYNVVYKEESTVEVGGVNKVQFLGHFKFSTLYAFESDGVNIYTCSCMKGC